MRPITEKPRDFGEELKKVLLSCDAIAPPEEGRRSHQIHLGRAVIRPEITTAVWQIAWDYCLHCKLHEAASVLVAMSHGDSRVWARGLAHRSDGVLLPAFAEEVDGRIVMRDNSRARCAGQGVLIFHPVLGPDHRLQEMVNAVRDAGAASVNVVILIDRRYGKGPLDVPTYSLLECVPVQPPAAALALEVSA